MSLSFAQLSQLTWPNWLPIENKTATTFDRSYLILALCMYTIGLIMVASSSMPIAERLFDNPFHFIIRHMIYIVLSIAVAGVALHIPMSRWHQSSGTLLLLGIFLLMVVLVVGRNVNGSTRWIALGPITIQAAEPAKLFFFCYLSAYLVRRRDEVMENVKGFAKPLVVFAVLGGLLLLQPDLGTIIVMFVTTFGLLFLAGAKLWQFIAIAGVGVSLLSMLAYLSPYRWARVTSFLDPWKDPFGSGYQLTQSLMAYGRGETLGQGLGNSVQKLEYLPEAHTDFVMAVLAEELGFIGISAILILSMTLVIKALLLGKKAVKQEKYFEGFFAYAIGIWFCFQAAVNIGASAGIVPTKGLTMPLISYGGSSMIIMTLAVVILIRIDHEIRLQSMQATSRLSAVNKSNKKTKSKVKKTKLNEGDND
ncbi:cell division-specific peptidoglycan biosynthesis regulator FtsW [Colwellia chukchiensis]|uniref:Probable peptidoglycan glycosyltransferase FtsW n=1 Tax=Colwellia chukchiensis TaxID=641665 RepID=A0A1H7L6C1_9GAMM|nr:cell division protein FtsW [Colwellia chukchiensis]SEK93975.1 cell division-specific peptidoglycan biosynthesis regulator FtsW [Colwellia chukchiensis]